MPILIARVPAEDADRMKMRIAMMFLYISQTMFVFYADGRRGDDAMLDALADFMWNSLSRWLEGEGLCGRT